MNLTNEERIARLNKIQVEETEKAAKSKGGAGF